MYDKTVKQKVKQFKYIQQFKMYATATAFILKATYINH